MSIFKSVGKITGKFDSTMSKLNHYEKKISGFINDPIGSLFSSPSFGSFSSGTLGKLIARPDPLMSFQWEVILPTITMAKAYNLGSEYVESCTLVLPEYSARQVRQNGRYTAYPEATVSIGTVSMQLYADVENTAFSYIHAWRTLIHPSDGVFGTPKQSKYTPGYSGYKNDIILVAKSTYNEDLFSVTYQNAWPVSISSTADFNSSGERLSFVVEFAIDNVIVSGYNIDTITGTISNAITGTISSIGKKLTDSVLDIGKSAISSVTKPITDKVTGWIDNLTSGEEGGGNAGGGGGNR